MSTTETTVISVKGRDRAALEADPSFVYVGRRCGRWPASVWGNPFKTTGPGARPAAECVALYRGHLESRPDLLAALPGLRGKVLGCWCGSWRPGAPEIDCHAVALAKLADGTACQDGQAARRRTAGGGPGGIDRHGPREARRGVPGPCDRAAGRPGEARHARSR